jgi:hypothetical protein
VVDAQRRLTQAPADADLAAVAAAAAGVEDAGRAAEVLTTRLAAQQRQLAEDRMRTIEEVVAQAGRVVDAGAGSHRRTARDCAARPARRRVTAELSQLVDPLFGSQACFRGRSLAARPNRTAARHLRHRLAAAGPDTPQDLIALTARLTSGHTTSAGDVELPF